MMLTGSVVMFRPAETSCAERVTAIAASELPDRAEVESAARVAPIESDVAFSVTAGRDAVFQ